MVLINVKLFECIILYCMALDKFNREVEVVGSCGKNTPPFGHPSCKEVNFEKEME
jgi:hypothetical protein